MRLVLEKSLIVKRCSIEESLRKNDFGNKVTTKMPNA
jgi:hypothetical protein